MHAPLDGLKPGKLKALSVIAMHGTEMEQRRRRMGWDFFDPCTHSILSAASSSFFLPSFPHTMMFFPECGSLHILLVRYTPAMAGPTACKAAAARLKK
jgi:hypothetical protein